MGKIYLIKCYNDSEVLYKIGFTRGETENRLKALETGNPNQLEVIEEFETKFNTRLENYLHQRFKSKKVKNEWFRLDNKDINNFIDVCETMEKNYDLLSKDNYYFKKLLNIK